MDEYSTLMKAEDANYKKRCSGYLQIRQQKNQEIVTAARNPNAES